jgi:hypothetical protein
MHPRRQQLYSAAVFAVLLAGRIAWHFVHHDRRVFVSASVAASMAVVTVLYYRSFEVPPVRLVLFAGLVTLLSFLVEYYITLGDWPWEWVGLTVIIVFLGATVTSELRHRRWP